MSGAFANAWMILKNRAQEEERSYGDVSHREHPLYGQEGYGQPAGRGHAIMRDPEEMEEEERLAEHEGQSEAEMMEEEGVEMPQRPHGPPANIGQAGSTGGAPPREGNPFQQAMGSLQQRGKPSL